MKEEGRYYLLSRPLIQRVMKIRFGKFYFMMIVVETVPVDNSFQLRIIYSWNFRPRRYHKDRTEPSGFSHEITKVRDIALLKVTQFDYLGFEFRSESLSRAFSPIVESWIEPPEDTYQFRNIHQMLAMWRIQWRKQTYSCSCVYPKNSFNYN